VATVSGIVVAAPNPPGACAMRKPRLRHFCRANLPQRNALLAQAFNRLAANLLTTGLEPGG